MHVRLFPIMLFLHLCKFDLLAGAVSTSWPLLRIQQAVTLPRPEHAFVLRKATLADVDDITDTFIDAFSPMPYYRHVYQFLDRYPKYHRQCIRASIEQVMLKANKDKVFVNVITSPPGKHGPSGRTVAVAIWTCSGSASISAVLGEGNYTVQSSIQKSLL